MNRSNHFITNSKESSLSNRMNNIMPSTDSLDFLVGYFYFSGIKEIYKNLDGKKVNILVGLELQENLMEKTAEFDFLQKKNAVSIEDERNSFYKSLVNMFGKTGYFDGMNEEAFKIYYNKIKDGTLTIRKTRENCHAKMYIFSYDDAHNEEGENKGCVITGSSNLTYNGLRGQNEINVRFKNNPEYEDAKEIFDELWKDENSILIADKNTIEVFDEKVIKHIWLEKVPSPYLLYLRVLHEYFNIDASKKIRTPNEITNDTNMKDLKYQIDAINLAIDKIGKHNGVIISDVVGLGKSVVASAVANNLKMRTIIIAPPHLVQQWEEYASDFRIKEAKIFSRGKIYKHNDNETALEFYREKSKKSHDEKWLVIIDEAHYFRNEYTQDYAALHELCKDNKVMLLTATPFNNQPSDIYSMIKLFQFPTKSTLQTVDNLGKAFVKLIADYKDLKKNIKKNGNSTENQEEAKRIGTRIRRIIEPLCIRRSRLDLKAIPEYSKDLEEQGFELPRVNDPEALEYNLGKLTELYISTLNKIASKNTEYYNFEKATTEEDATEDEINEDEWTDNVENGVFKAARYKPIMYVKTDCIEDLKKEIEKAGFKYNLFKTAQSNMAKFMRTLLVRRFESSQAAFKKSLNNMLEYCENVKNWIDERKAIPVYKKGMLPDIKDLYESTEDSLFAEQEIETKIEKLKDKDLFEIKTKYLDDNFFEDLNSDIEILKNLKERWDNVDENNDPKYIEFEKIIKEKLENDTERKIVIFSQFADTVKYLEKRLIETNLPIFAYTSSKANKENKETIKRNFDAGYKYGQKNDYKILVATDAISEGYNLHRAGTIFNYDIPYNPTRVIQRIGRINRINKKMFNELFIYNYFPGLIGENETRIKEISTLKMAMIHTIMGEDTKILTKEEELKNYFAARYKTLIASDEAKSWDAEYRTEYDAVKNTEYMKNALLLPLRSRVRRITSPKKEMQNGGVLVFARKGNDFFFKKVEYGTTDFESENVDVENALEILKFDKEKELDIGKPVSVKFKDAFATIQESLLKENTKGENKMTKTDVLHKIQIIYETSKVKDEYADLLKNAIECDSVPGFYLRKINQLTPKEYEYLPQQVSEFYLKKIMKQFNSIERGADLLILAEEFENV